LFGNRLEDNQLRNVLKTIGINVTYDDHKMTTDIELELHLRAYVLALETYGKRLVKMEKELLETLHENLTKLYDFHQHHTKVIEKGLLLQSPRVLFATLEKSVKVQNYNNDFLLMHLYNTLHVLDDKTAWLEIINQLRAFFAALVEALPGMTGIMTTVETPIDNKATIEIYNNVQKALQSKFSVGHWYKEWRYLYAIHQEFVEWSATPIHRNFVAKGELMIIKDLWRFGDQEWSKAVSAKSEINRYKSKLKNLSDHISESVPYLLLFGILDIAQSLIISTRNTNTLAHCYYLAKLSLDIVKMEHIQFKAMEVLITLHKKDSITFSVVQVDLDQHAETLNQDKKRLQDMRGYIDKKYTYLSQAGSRTNVEMPVLRQKA